MNKADLCFLGGTPYGIMDVLSLRDCVHLDKERYYRPEAAAAEKVEEIFGVFKER